MSGALVTQYNNETANPIQMESETNRRGERDVVSGARDTTSGRAGAVADRQLLEVQPDQGGQGGQGGQNGTSWHAQVRLTHLPCSSAISEACAVF